MSHSASRSSDKSRPCGATIWKLEDAKAQFSEVVRRAHDQGPQAVTVRGKRAVVVVDADEYDRLAGPAHKASFVEFLQSLDLAEIGIDRETDNGREIDL